MYEFLERESDSRYTRDQLQWVLLLLAATHYHHTIPFHAHIHAMRDLAESYVPFTRIICS